MINQREDKKPKYTKKEKVQKRQIIVQSWNKHSRAHTHEKPTE